MHLALEENPNPAKPLNLSLPFTIPVSIQVSHEAKRGEV